MRRYLCDTPSCNGKVLFEGDFKGTIKKRCPKCKKMKTFTESANKLEKFCKM